MTSLTGRPPTQKAQPQEKPARWVFVVCPFCEGSGIDRILIRGVDTEIKCPVCQGDKKVKAEYIRMAPGSARTKGTVKYRPGDKDWSHAVRERDGWKCRWCGKQHTPWTSESQGRLVCDTLDAAHLFRRRHGMTRQDLRDGFAMCAMSCHGYVDSHKEEFHRWARQELGEDVYEDLRQRSEQTKKRSPRRKPVTPRP